MTQASGQSKAAGPLHHPDMEQLLAAQSGSSTDTALAKALELVLTALDDELGRSLRAVARQPEIEEKISRLIATSPRDPVRVALEIAKQSEAEKTAIRRVARRLRHLRGGSDDLKFTATVVTWLCTTGGMLTALTAPGTMPEINSQVAILSAAVAITAALNANRSKSK